MSIGNINEEEFLGPEYPFKGRIKHNEWDQKRKYEENVIMVDVRAIDTDGTLEICQKEDRSLCKTVPEVKIIDGRILIKIRRER